MARRTPASSFRQATTTEIRGHSDPSGSFFAPRDRSGSRLTRIQIQAKRSQVTRTPPSSTIGTRLVTPTVYRGSSGGREPASRSARSAIERPDEVAGSGISPSQTRVRRGRRRDVRRTFVGGRSFVRGCRCGNRGPAVGSAGTGEGGAGRCRLSRARAQSFDRSGAVGDRSRRGADQAGALRLVS